MPENKKPPDPNPKQERRRQLQRLRQKLEGERLAWSRWMPRLKRAFTAVLKIDRRARDLERQIARLAAS
jgi:hypothetical protein